MKVYVAADFARAAEVNDVAGDIERRTSAHVVSRWHRQLADEERAAAGRVGGPPAGQALAAARRNLADVDACDVFIVLTTGALARGGRHFETGYAIARAKPVVVVGPVEHAFQHLASRVVTEHIEITDELLSHVLAERRLKV